MQFKNSNPSHDVAQTRLIRIVDKLKKVLSPQYPIKNFVHHNSIEGYQYLPFEKALKASEEASGCKGFLDESKSQAFFQEGRINDYDLREVLKKQPALADNTQISDDIKITKLDIVLNRMVHGIQEVKSNQLAWSIEELGVLERFQKNVSDDAKQQIIGKELSLRCRHSASGKSSSSPNLSFLSWTSKSQICGVISEPSLVICS